MMRVAARAETVVLCAPLRTMTMPRSSKPVCATDLASPAMRSCRFRSECLTVLLGFGLEYVRRFANQMENEEKGEEKDESRQESDEPEDPAIFRAALLPTSDDAIVSRRSFIKGTIAVTGAAYLMSVLGGCDDEEMTPSSPSTSPTTQEEPTTTTEPSTTTTESPTTTTEPTTTTDSPTTTEPTTTEPTVPAEEGESGGLYCSCDSVCTCEAVCTCDGHVSSGGHYWYPC